MVAINIVVVSMVAVIAQQTFEVQPIVDAIELIIGLLFGNSGFIIDFIKVIVIDWVWDGFMVGLFETNMFGSTPITRLGWALAFIIFATAGGVVYYGARRSDY